MVRRDISLPHYFGGDYHARTKNKGARPGGRLGKEAGKGEDCGR
jgi:hypothetical protein